MQPQARSEAPHVHEVAVGRRRTSLAQHRSHPLLSPTAAEASSGWNSLEITKLAVAVATPLVVLIGGWMLTRWLQKRIDIEDKLIERGYATAGDVGFRYLLRDWKMES